MNWSYSKLSRYEKCPASYNFRYNLKIADPAGKAAQRGTDQHAIAEDYVSGKIESLPDTIHHQHVIKDLRAAEAKTEHALYFTSSWQLQETEKDYWCVMKIDALHHVPGAAVNIWDYKTGRFYENHYDQLMLYGLGALIAYPDVKVVGSAALYIDQPNTTPVVRTVYPEQLESLKEYYNGRVNVMFNDDKYVPNPGGHCKWCNYSKKKGGPCQF